MSENDPKNQTAIISIIEEMVRAGEPEDKIVKTLENLGVDPANARQLLLLGEADTFALVKSEISKMVAAEMEKAKPEFYEKIRAENAGRLQLDRQAIENDIRAKYQSLSDLEGYRKDLEARMTTSAAMAERAEAASKSLDKMMTEARRDIRELMARTGGGQWQALNKFLLLVGVVLGVFSAVFFYVQFQSTGLTVDSVLAAGLIALVSITMMIISSLAV